MSSNYDFMMGSLVGGIESQCDSPEEEVAEYRELIAKLRAGAPPKSKAAMDERQKMLRELEHHLADAEKRCQKSSR